MACSGNGRRPVCPCSRSRSRSRWRCWQHTDADRRRVLVVALGPVCNSSSLPATLCAAAPPGTAADRSQGMWTEFDPRKGDIESDASSSKRRSMLALAGSLLAEVSLPKLIVAWTSLLVLPSLTFGAIPIAVSIWINVVQLKLSTLALGLSSVLVFASIVAVGLVGARPLFRLAERNFWSLNSLAVQPA